MSIPFRAPATTKPSTLAPTACWCLRDRDGTVRAFHNVLPAPRCAAAGRRRTVSPLPSPAPYHGWSYRHDGGLVGTPKRDSFPESRSRRARPARGTDRHRVRLRFRMSRARCRPPATAGGANLGSAGRRIEALPHRGDGGRSAPSPRTSGTSTGRSPWTTTSSPTTCPLATRVCIACSRRTTMTRRGCRALPGASVGCVNTARHVGRKGCTNR